MLHIAFGSSKELNVYNAVLMTSIVKNTNLNKSFKDICKEFGSKEQEEGYHFHILTDDDDEERLKNFNLLTNELNKSYPCKLSIHIMNNDEFDDFSTPEWVWGNKAMFYKNKIASIVTQSDRCLVLGTDTLALGDIRELFAINLDGYLIAAALDCCNYDSYIRIAKAKNAKDEDLVFKYSKFYINNDVMMINLNEWREQDIESKLTYYLKNYHLKGVLDVFPLVCAPKIKVISNKFNLIIGNFTREQLGLENTYKNQTSEPFWNYTQEELKEMREDVRIVQFCHYHCHKPWECKYYNPFWAMSVTYRPLHYPYYEDWWDIALQTPIFSEYFRQLQIRLKEEELNCYSITLDLILRRKEEILKQRIQAKEENLEQRIQALECSKYGAKERIQNQLCYKLGKAMLENSKNIIKCIQLPFVLLNIIRIHKKERKLYKTFIKINPELKLKPLETYADYEQALKCKEHLSYQLGLALMSVNNKQGGGFFKLPFRIYRIAKEFKNSHKT